MCRIILVFALFTLVLPGSAQSSSAAPGDAPLTLDQLRQLMDATSVTELIGNLNRRKLDADKATLPPWWPDDVWQAYKDAVEKIDMPAVYLPFYQPCYSQKEARLFIDMFSTPEGHAYARRAQGLEAKARENGATAEEARTDTMKQDRGLSPEVLRSLDADDHAEANVVFRSPRGAAITACVSAGLPKGEVAFQALQRDAAKAVIDAHGAELAAAEAKYLAEHPASAPAK